MFRGIRKIAAEIAAFPWYYLAFSVLAGVVAKLVTNDTKSIVVVSILIPIMIAAIVTVRYGAYNIRGSGEDGFCSEWKRRVATIATGHTFNIVFDHLFNYWLYFSVIALMGPVKGGALLAVTDAVVSLVFIKFYDWAKKDWLGIEVAKEVRDIGPLWIRNLRVTSLVGRILWWPFSKMILLILWSMRRGKIVAFFVLSILTDPFITTVYLRKGSFNGMTRRDWAIFFASVVLGNGWWTVRAYAIITLARFGIGGL